MSFKQSGDGKFFVVAEKDPLWIDLTMVFDPATGILKAEAESLEGGYSNIEIDLATEFWRMTRREAPKEMPPSNVPVLVGIDLPGNIMEWDAESERWIDESGLRYYNGSHFYWWPLLTEKKE